MRHRLENVPVEDMSEVVRVASELYDREQAENRERKATVDAAGEMGIPPEYMERAAAEVHARRVARIGQNRRRRSGVLAALTAVVMIGVGWQFTRTAPAPSPAAYAHLSVGAWQLDKNGQSDATVSFETDATTIRVRQFRKGADGTYFVNLNTAQVPPTLAGYRTVSFHVRGDGGLPNVRLYLENGPTERWRSPQVSVPTDGKTVRFRLNQFDYQTRTSSADRWREQRFRSPAEIKEMSFKVGEFMNDVTARGEVTVDDLRFE